MIYNFNLGIGWASSGVEYAQAYRANIFRKLGKEAKFVFTDMFPRDNIEHMTKNIGFKDSEVIWLYTFFTDTKISPVTYTLKQLEGTFAGEDFTFERNGSTAKYVFPGNNNFYTVYMVDETSDLVHRVEMVSEGCLIRKDYFTYCRLYSEYYAPRDNKAWLYQRRFFNEDGTTAYEEIIDDANVMYQFPDKLLYSKEELVGYMVSRLKLKSEDVVIIDRTTGIGQAIIQNAGKAKIGIIIHADHFSEGSTTDSKILWNNYYEYSFAQNKHIDFYVTATRAQKELLEYQFEKYMGVSPKIYAIPVGSIDELKYPETARKPYSIITASRLASEKHIDWVVEAVALAHDRLPELSLDIYGKGGEEERLKTKIHELNAESYIHLCGQQKLDDVYKNYEIYVAGSTSEGFGLTLLEAVASGLPIIGFDVRYGNQTFIDDGLNGYILDYSEEQNARNRIKLMADSIEKIFTEVNLESFHEHSYEKASEFLTKEVEKKWKKALKKQM